MLSGKIEGGGEREKSGWAGQQACIFRVRLWKDRKIEGRDRDTERQKDIETKRHRHRAYNKNPEQSRIAQLVIKKILKCFTKIVQRTQSCWILAVDGKYWLHGK